MPSNDIYSRMNKRLNNLQSDDEVEKAMKLIEEVGELIGTIRNWFPIKEMYDVVLNMIQKHRQPPDYSDTISPIIIERLGLQQ